MGALFAPTVLVPHLLTQSITGTIPLKRSPPWRRVRVKHGNGESFVNPFDAILQTSTALDF